MKFIDRDGEIWHDTEVDPLEAESVYGMVRVTSQDVECWCEFDYQTCASPVCQNR